MEMQYSVQYTQLSRENFRMPSTLERTVNVDRSLARRAKITESARHFVSVSFYQFGNDRRKDGGHVRECLVVRMNAVHGHLVAPV